MITLDEKIARAERLLRRLQDDQPYLAMRVAALATEPRQTVCAFVDCVRLEAEAELQRLLAQRGPAHDCTPPQPAD